MEHFVPSQYARNIFVLLSAYLFSYNSFFHVIRQIAYFKQVLPNKNRFYKKPRYLDEEQEKVPLRTRLMYLIVHDE